MSINFDYFVKELNDRVYAISKALYKDSVKVSMLRGALLVLLEVNPDNNINGEERTERNAQLFWDDDDDI